MNTSTIRQKLSENIRVADDKKIKAIYTIIESDVNESYEWRNDKTLVAELDSRSSDLKSGKDKGLSWDEVKKELLTSWKKLMIKSSLAQFLPSSEDFACNQIQKQFGQYYY